MPTPEPKILTLIARSTAGDYVLPDGNQFLRQVAARAEATAQRCPSYRVAGVSSVNEIRPAVRGFADSAGLLLQLVGHGRPGELELAFSWERRYRDELRFYLLDNNSRGLAMLAGCRGVVREVRLVACNIGGEEGHPLMFTLSKLLGCSVSAALGTVVPGSFHPATGLYGGAMSVCARRTQRFSQVPATVTVVAPAPVVAPRSARADPPSCLAARTLTYVRELARSAAASVLSPQGDEGVSGLARPA